MSYMFNKCYSLISLNLSNFNTSSVKNMKCMLDQCHSLASLNLSDLKINNTQDLQDVPINLNEYCNITLYLLE